MKKIIRTILLSILCIMFCSGLINIISDYNNKKWQPYQQGDTLTFLSSNGDTAKWDILQIEKVHNPSDPLLLWKPWIYSTFVCTKKDLGGIIVNISIKSGKRTIILEPCFRRGTLRIKENETKLTKMKYHHSEVLVLKPDHDDWHGDPYLQTVYWSPQYGYIKVFYSDSTEWELISFIRNGISLYKREP